MINRTIICGLALVIIGIYGYIQGVENTETDNKDRLQKWEQAGKPDPMPELKVPSKTAFIPAVVGGILILCGVFVLIAPKARKHVMHFAAVVGVLGAIGGFVPIIRSGDFDLAKPAIKNGLLMTVVCVVFVVFCVQSFIEARKARTNPL